MRSFSCKTLFSFVFAAASYDGTSLGARTSNHSRIIGRTQIMLEVPCRRAGVSYCIQHSSRLSFVGPFCLQYACSIMHEDYPRLNPFSYCNTLVHGQNLICTPDLRGGSQFQDETLVLALITKSYHRYMWSKRHRSACGLLCLSLILLLIFSSAPHKVQQHISSNLPNYKQWTGGFCSNNTSEEPLPERITDTSTSTETTLPGHSATPGFVIFDRLYVRNRTLYAVTNSPEAFPSLVYILSQPKDRNGENIDPTPQVGCVHFSIESHPDIFYRKCRSYPKKKQKLPWDRVQWY